MSACLSACLPACLPACLCFPSYLCARFSQQPLPSFSSPVLCHLFINPSPPPSLSQFPLLRSNACSPRHFTPYRSPIGILDRDSRRWFTRSEDGRHHLQHGEQGQDEAYLAVGGREVLWWPRVNTERRSGRQTREEGGGSQTGELGHQRFQNGRTRDVGEAGKSPPCSFRSQTPHRRRRRCC